MTLKLAAGHPATDARSGSRGKGVRRSDGTNGDLLVTVEVQVPQHLNGTAREALEIFRDATAGQDPRADLLQRARGG